MAFKSDDVLEADLVVAVVCLLLSLRGAMWSG